MSIQDSLAALRELRAVGFAEQIEHSGKDGAPIQVWHFGGRKVEF